MTAMLASFLPEAEKPFAERTPDDKRVTDAWFGAFNWYSALRRAGFAPAFGPDPKRQRTA